MGDKVVCAGPLVTWWLNYAVARGREPWGAAGLLVTKNLVRAVARMCFRCVALWLRLSEGRASCRTFGPSHCFPLKPLLLNPRHTAGATGHFPKTRRPAWNPYGSCRSQTPRQGRGLTSTGSRRRTGGRRPAYTRPPSDSNSRCLRS